MQERKASATEIIDAKYKIDLNSESLNGMRADVFIGAEDVGKSEGIDCPKKK